jgi:hypothetical protein
MGRWTNPDPSGLTHADLMNPQSLNLYNYVGNNPLTRTDLDGLCWKGFQWACSTAQAFDNAFHGLGFHTDRQVENILHRDNLALRQNGIDPEGLKDSQVMRAAKLLGGVGAGRPTAAQARSIWEKATGQKVPWDEEMGRYYDMHHTLPIKDGGAPRDPNNLTPMQHGEHMELHSTNGDYTRWARQEATGTAAGEEDGAGLFLQKDFDGNLEMDKLSMPPGEEPE